MSEKSEIQITLGDWLDTLEKVKKQYQQYVEVSKIYELPIQKEEEEPTPDSIPSLEHPLTFDASFWK